MKPANNHILDKQMNANKKAFRQMLVWLLLIVAIGCIVFAALATIPAPCCNKSQNVSGSSASSTQDKALVEGNQWASILLKKEARFLLSTSACCLLAAIAVAFDLARYARIRREA